MKVGVAAVIQILGGTISVELPACLTQIRKQRFGRLSKYVGKMGLIELTAHEYASKVGTGKQCLRKQALAQALGVWSVVN